jgi:hypothetical protein
MNIRRIALGLIVSAICLYFVLRGVDWGEVLNHLSQVNLPLFLLSMVLMLVAYFLMAWRWQLLLAPLELPTPALPTQDGVDRGTPLSGGLGVSPNFPYYKSSPLPSGRGRGWVPPRLPTWGTAKGVQGCPLTSPSYPPIFHIPSAGI